MQIIAFSAWDEIVPHAESWDRLARDVPFRSWTWLSSWWRHYGPQSPEDRTTRLMVLGVLDTSGRLAGIAPWYLERSAAKGWVLRWLGSGEVCSDYASILCMPDDADRVTEAIAAYLTGSNCAPGGRHGWDLLEIDGVDGEDSIVTRLLRQLDERGCTQHENTAGSYLAACLAQVRGKSILSLVSKGTSQETSPRRSRSLPNRPGRAAHGRELRSSSMPALDVLIDLHQKRRQMLGEPGCFASPQFTAFHREVARRLLLGRPVTTSTAGTRRPDGGRGISTGQPGRYLRLSGRHRSAAVGRRAGASDHRRDGEAGHRARRAGRRFPPRRRAVQGPFPRPRPAAAGFAQSCPTARCRDCGTTSGWPAAA